MWKLIAGTERTHFLENFRVAAGLAEGRCRGAAWNDGETYKWLEAACSLLIVQPDAELRAHVDEAVKVIAQAQRADGYLYTKVRRHPRRSVAARENRCHRANQPRRPAHMDTGRRACGQKLLSGVGGAVTAF